MVDLEKLAKRINESVESVIHSKEVQELKESLKNTFEETFVEVKETVNDAVSNVNENVKKAVPPYHKGTTKKYLPVKKNPEGKVMGVLFLLFGWGLFSVMSVATIIFLVFDILSFIESGFLAILPFAFLLPLLLGGMGMGIVGNRLCGRIKRFKIYRKLLEEKAFCNINQLAVKLDKKDKFVLKDLQKMMERHWFLEGHLDEKKTCFMATEEAYRQYVEAEEALVRKEEEEKRKAEKEKEYLRLHPENEELNAVIQEGQHYMREIRRVNNDIPSEDISTKLYKLESIIGKIFNYIKRKPEKIPEIRKFISYYLPTTLKLVQAYYEFDTQPVQGENIKKGKKEIEETLDQINQAFGKMFDQLFQEDVLDISSDISVLSTMLAKDGLMKDDFS